MKYRQFYRQTDFGYYSEPVGPILNFLLNLRKWLTGKPTRSNV